MVTDKDIEQAFVAVALDCKRGVRHGKWIPVTYWAEKMGMKLRTKVTPRKIVRLLEKTHAMHRLFTPENDGERYGNIQRIECTERRIVKEPGKSPSRVHFLCITSDDTPKQEILLENQTELGQLFEDRFHAYSRRKSVLLAARRGALTVDINSNNEQEQAENPRTVTPTDNSSEKTNDNLETERPNALYDSNNKDILELLEMIVSPELLRNAQFLKEGACMKAVRSKIQKMGTGLQMEENVKYFDTLAADRYDDTINMEDAGKYTPFLDRFCCPLRKRAIHGFLRVVLKIDSESNCGLLQLPKFGGNGYGQRLVPVVPADTPKTFYKNGKAWLPNLYHALVGANSTMSRYDVCYWLMKLHRFHEPQAFDDVCRTSKVKSMKMDPYRQIAMFHKTNMTYEHGRGMRPYFNAEKCNPLQSERVIRKLEKHPSVAPVYTVFKEDRTERHAWCVPISEVVKEEISKRPPADELHAVLSADHGQRAFRVNVGAVYINEGSVQDESNLLVGHVDCKKDTRQVLEDSKVLSNVNDSLKQLKAESEKDGNPKVTLLGQGDMAWSSMALGKAHMSPHHCWRCMLSSKDFQEDPCKVGEPWTIAKMKERFKKLESGELNRKNKSLEKGLTHLPLIDCIEPEDWVFPVLHAIDLLTNTPYKYLQRWIWNRIEEVALELIDARDAMTEAALKVDALWQDILDAEEHMNHMEFELADLAPADGAFDDAEHERDYCNQENILKEAETALKKANQLHDDAKAAFKKARATVNAMEKKKEHGKTTQDLWMQIERKLRKDFNIHSSTYHGGDMEGNECRRLLRNAVPAMDAVKELLLAYVDGLPPEERKQKADKEEIEMFVGAFKRLFQYMDLLSHFAYQPYGSLTDDDLADASRTVRLATELWVNLMPTVPMKVHAWQHLLEDLRRFRGLKFHTEQPVERCHQEGKKHENRLRCFRDFRKKTENIRKHMATAECDTVQAMHRDTEAKKKKRRQNSEDESAKAAAERAAYLKSILVLPVIEDDLPSLLDLAKRDSSNNSR